MTLLLLPFRSQIHTAVAPLIYLVLVVFVALAWGMGAAAIIASLAGALAFHYYVLAPLNAFSLNRSKEWSALLAFLITSVTAGKISMRERRAAVEAEAAQMERLQQQAGELREQAQLLDLAHDAIMVRDLDGRIRFWNQGAAERYGWSNQETIGRITHQLLQSESPQPLEEINAQLQRESFWEGELEHSRRDGKRIVVAGGRVLKHSNNSQSHAVWKALAAVPLVKRRETLEIDNPMAEDFLRNIGSGSAISQERLLHGCAHCRSIKFPFPFVCFLVVLAAVPFCLGQNAQIAGTVTDRSKAVIPNASVEIIETATQVKWDTISNGDGRYVAPSLAPGVYQITVRAPTFETQMVRDLRLNVASKVSLDFVLHPGAVSQSVTVDGSGINLNTTDASVSTVIDRRLIENLPLNGRSFQSLMALAPGVLVVPSQGVGQSGELSVNGQRTESNYFTVDGVSADIGASVSSSGYTGAGFAGATPGETALGTTQSLVSIDALQEFRATTSTYSAEYGRGPGGQFLFQTRSGTNQYHGTAFDYLRNDALDANSWFNGYTNAPPVPKQALRQNDFGGTLGGFLDIPHLYNGRNRTFFFFSYEGLRLINPTPSQLYEVPSNDLRQKAPDALKPFLASFPVSTQPDNGNGLSYYTAGYSAPSSIDTSSIRIDHSFSDNFKIFGRYSDSPSNSTSRQPSDLAQVNASIINMKTLTLGATNVLSPTMANEFRFNLTGNDYKSSRTLDRFGGATPIDVAGIPGLQSDSWLTFFLFYDLYPYYLLEPQSNRERQVNVVDTFTHTIGRHNFRFGVDYRRLVASEALPSLWEVGFYYDEASVLANRTSGINMYKQSINMKAVYPNTSLFAQDEWKVNDRLSLSYGVRWEINPAPHDANGNTPYTVDQITDLSTVKLAPKGTALWKTTYGNFAPRLGAAYQIHQTPGSSMVLRAGAGLFYDTGTQLAADGYYGVGTTGFQSFNGDAFPLTMAQIDSVPQPNASPPYNVAVWGFDPHLKLPYTVQWNVAVEQQLGEQQTLNINYVASASRRLLTQNFYSPDLLGNPNFASGNGLYLTINRASADYQSLQVRFQRSLAHGFQGLLAYTWSHSLDNASTNFTIYELERGPSDFDVRNNFQAALSYDIPGHYSNAWVSYALKHWSLDTRISARSALPVDIFARTTVDSSSGQGLHFHPDRDLSQPMYTYNPMAPTGRQINPQAFKERDDANGNVIEGNAGRNSARGFDAVQADATVLRDFPFTDRIGLQFRAEAYNIFNHPSFGSIYNSLDNGPLFGQAYTSLASQLGGLSPIYQLGGARSMQVALKLHF